MNAFAKRIVPALLVIAMLLGMLPMAAFASDDPPAGSTPVGTVDAATAAQLETALQEGAPSIRITADFEVDRTFFITSNTEIFTDQAHTLTRAADFAGDIFVVGQTAEGLLTEEGITLILGDAASEEKDLLIIDGNSAAMTVDVVGTVIFVATSSVADLHENLTVQNCKKVGNDRATDTLHGMSNTANIGGAAMILAKSATANVYGGKYLNNTVNTTGTASAYGGAFYNFGTFNMYGGLVEGGQAVRAGALYNYRTANLHAGSFKNNFASSLGGAIYAPASGSSFTYIGKETDKAESGFSFIGNTASRAGAIMCQATMDIVDSTFEANAATDDGGALYCSNKSNITITRSAFIGNSATDAAATVFLSGSTLTVKDSTFSGGSSNRGAGLYVSGQSEEAGKFDVTVTTSTFTNNTVPGDGAGLYITGGARVYMTKTDIIKNSAGNSSDQIGGGIYINEESTLEYNGGTLSENTAYQGGGIYMSEGARVLLNKITAEKNVTSSHGGVFYSLGGKLTVYNSTFNNNTAHSGGVAYLYTDASATIYNSSFTQNTANGASGGALFIYTGIAEGVSTHVQDCDFTENTAKTYGGAFQISGPSIVGLYDLTGTDNVGTTHGGFAYITKAKTVVTVSGLTVKGNESPNGPIIWGNTLNATLVINKANYVDQDATGALDDAYWSEAIMNKIVVTESDVMPPEYLDYRNESAGNLEGSLRVYNADELEAAINAGIREIRISESFELDRTFYITRDTLLFSTTDVVLTRAADFGGDLFVIGEDAEGNNALLSYGNATLTLGNPISATPDLLVIDGNKTEMKVDVVGTTFFIFNSGIVNLYDNVTVRNAHKTGNERTYVERYDLSVRDRIGGPVAILANGTLNIYGGNYHDNSTNEENVYEETPKLSTLGGAIYNEANVRMYGGTFSGNHAARAGAIFNYRVIKLYGGTFKGNSATSMGGVFILQDTAASQLFIGTEDTTDTPVLFENNYAGSNGAVAYAAALSEIIVFGADFIGNESASNGGALCSYGTLTVKNSLFRDNEASNRGGAIYVSVSNDENDPRHTNITNSVFEGNEGAVGGAISTYAGADDYVNGVILFASDCSFSNNRARKAKETSSTAFGGAYYSDRKTRAEFTDCTFTSNSAELNGGAIYTQKNCNTLLVNATFEGNEAEGNGGAIYNLGSTLNLYDSTLTGNSAVGGGAAYLYTGAVSGIYNSTFTGNSSTEGSGGALFIYTGNTDENIFTRVQSCTLDSNTAKTYGGAIQISGASKVYLYDLIGTNNTADTHGGFAYITKAGTDVTLNGLTLDNNTAPNGPAIWGNTENATLNIHKGSVTDKQAQAMDEAYWTAAIAGKLTVKEISGDIPDYPSYIEAPAVSDKDPVPVTDVLNLAKHSSDADINKNYNKLGKLDNSSNFMSRAAIPFKNINGEDVTVDTFVYGTNEKANNGNVGLGLLIYQSILYKEANPEEEVYIDVSSYRFSVQCAVNINRNSRYFGYMRDLPKQNYDEYGFVRISYLLITAAKMGINLTVIGNLDGYPIDSTALNFNDYFTSQLADPCDPKYAEGKTIGDFMKFRFCYWTLHEKGGTDMMHTKMCAVSHYLDMNGVAHKNAVWSSSANIDGIKSDGRNANWKQQTATIVTNHEAIYRVTSNYLRLMSDYCGQEQVYEMQHYINDTSAAQADLILAGRGDEIDPLKQIIYLGTEEDKVFELYFTPFGSPHNTWDDNYQPFCKYVREMYESEDYILFTWNAAEYSNGYPFAQEIEQMISAAFHKNRDVRNKIYCYADGFNEAAYDDLIVGKDIGYKSFNEMTFGKIHNKDLQFSYVKNGERQFVSLLNSCNAHSGSMSYQSNFALVIKETGCSKNTVFGTIADLTTTGDIEGHTYGREMSYLPENGDGYTYYECGYCGHKEITGTAHHESEWILDRPATADQKGIEHKQCLTCGEILESREILFTQTSLLPDTTLTALSGKRFTKKASLSVPTTVTTPHTLEATVQVSPKISGRAGVIVGNYNGGKGAQLNLEIYSKGRPRLYYKSGKTVVNCVFATDIRSDSARHVAVTVSGKNATLYVDGIKKETRRLSISLPTLTLKDVRIGGDNRKGNAQYFKGTIYGINLFKDIRSVNEISADARLVSGNASGLIYSTFFTDDAAMRATLQGATFSAEQLVELGRGVAPAPKTVETILQVPTSLNDRGGVIVGNYNGGTDSQFNLEVYTKGRIRLYFVNDGKAISHTFNTDIRSDSPRHVAVTVSGKTATLYVDGAKAETATLQAALPATLVNLKVGGDNRNGNARYFKGKIYSIHLLEEVRSAAQIKADGRMVDNATPALIFGGYFTDIVCSNKNGGKAHKASDWMTATEGEYYKECLFCGTKLVSGTDTKTAASLKLTDAEGFAPSATDSLLQTSPLNTAPKTIELTLQLSKDHTARGGVLFGNYTGGNEDQFNLEIYSNGRPRLYYKVDGKAYTHLFNFDIRSESKTHLALTLDGTTATLFVNGKKAESAVLEAAPVLNGTFGVGGDNRLAGTPLFAGTIYSLHLFDHVRSNTRLATDMILVPDDTTGTLLSEYYL